MSETCWVCLRITPEYVLKAAHKTFDKHLDSIIVHALASEASQIIHDGYSKKPMFFCGKASKTILGGLFYILAYKHSFTQREIALGVDCVEVSIRVNYVKWLKEFPCLKAHMTKPIVHHHKWKYVKQVNYVQTLRCECGKTQTRHIKPNTVATRFWQKHYGYYP